MFDTHDIIESPTGARLAMRRAIPTGEKRGVVIVLHGLAEHSARYATLARDLTALGFCVYAHDHRGHGHTRAPDAPPRRFAARKGAERVLEDCEAVGRLAGLEQPGLPLVIFGHSMGAIIATNLIKRRSLPHAGVALWNGGLGSAGANLMGRGLLRIERAVEGSDVSSELFSRLTFENWAKAIPNRRSDADWLSHDASAVAAYEADPLCGFRPTVSMADDVLALAIGHGMVRPPHPASGDLPIHILGGGADPATHNGVQTERLAERYRAKGWRNVESLVVPGARHETLNEIEAYRSPAMASLTGWLDRITPRL